MELLLTEVIICADELASHLIIDVAPDADATRLRELLQPRGNVHPVAINRTVGLLDHIAQVDPSLSAKRDLKLSLSPVGYTEVDPGADGFSEMSEPLSSARAHELLRFANVVIATNVAWQIPLREPT